MRRPVRVLLALCVLAAGTAVVAVATTSGSSPDPAPGSADELATRSDRPVDVLDREGGAARFVGTEPGAPLDLGADELTSGYADLLGATDGELVEIGTQPSLAGGTAVRYQQELDGVPVFGAQASVQLDADGRVRSALADLSTRLAGPVPGAEVPAAAARATAIASVARETGAPPAALSATEPVRQVYDPSVIGADDTFGVRRTWLVEVTATAPPVRHTVLVDATTGGVAFSGNRLAHALDRKVCDFANVANADETCTVFARTEGAGPSAVAEVNQAYEFSGDTYDWFWEQFGRDGLNDDGAPIVSAVRYCETASACPYANAFWNGEQATYGQGYAVDDVVAHELAHGVTEFTANLFYWYQSGAINESISDVFGELVDQANGTDDTPANRWLVGEDLPGGALRDMEDPPARSDPDSTTHVAYVPGPSDGGGVHSNSGVNNKAAVLMVDGGTFGGRTVTALGPAKVGAVYYEALTTMLTSASDFQDLHAALPQACANLVTAGVAGLTAADCLEVRDAVDAVGMHVVPPAAPATDAPVCAGEPVATLFTDDVEATHDGRWTFATPTGPYRWAYGSESDVVYATSGVQGFWGPNTGATADRILAMSAAVALPAAGHPVLHFRHAYGFESTGTSYWDGGVVEYSTSGPDGPWIDLGPMLEVNGYPGTLVATGTNPLKGRPAFVDESKGYLTTRADLSPLAGQSVRFRFRVGEDVTLGDYGWFVDDITVADCPAPALTAELEATPAAVVAGEVVDLDLDLHNTGNVALTGVEVSHSSATSCDQAVADLAPGAATTVECSYTTVDPDDVGTWTDTATVTAVELVEPVVTDPVEVEVAAVDPEATVGLAAAPASVTVGDDIEVDVTVANTGNVDLTGVTLALPAAPDCEGPLADLAPGEDVRVECTRTTVDPDDIGTWEATATVSADQLDEPAASSPATVTVLAPETPAMTVGFRTDVAQVGIGQAVPLTVTVTNTGNLALTGVTVAAPGAPACASGPHGDPLPVGGELVLQCAHTPSTIGTWSSTVSATTAELPEPISSPTVEVDVLDDVAPTVTLTSPADGLLVNQGSELVADFSCADAHSPVTCSAVLDGVPVEPGAVLDTSAPGDHTVTVTALDDAGNPAEVTHTYTVAVRRPDGRIRRGVNGVTVGDDRYNVTGAHQTRTIRIAPRRSVTFFVTVQNDGSHPEAFRVHGQPSTPNYQVQYVVGGVNISAKARKGTYQTPVLQPGQVRAVKVVVTVGARAPVGSQVRRLITATSVSDPTVSDAVRVIVRRR